MKKSTDFHVRISDDELELIDEKARQLRMTRSKYVIQSALHQKIITLDNTAIKQLTSELRKIGINVNQKEFPESCNVYISRTRKTKLQRYGKN